MIFLLTEPIVIAWSLWIGLLWAQVFMLYAGVPTVFAIYDFDVAQTGLVFVSIAVAAFFVSSDMHLHLFFSSKALWCSSIGSHFF